MDLFDVLIPTCFSRLAIGREMRHDIVGFDSKQSELRCTGSHCRVEGELMEVIVKYRKMLP